MRRLGKGTLVCLGLLVSIVGCKEAAKAPVMPPQEITVVEVQEKEVPIYIEQVGQVYGLKDIPIRARVDGFLEDISFDEIIEENEEEDE